MENKSLVSIVIPNFNKAKFISETIKSVIDQTYSNIEIILVDDGSTDDSLNVIDNLCNLHNNIRLIKRERKPKGGSTCRNLGIENSKGDFIMFLDSDDLITPTCIENRVDFMKQEESDFVVFNTGTFNDRIGDSSLNWLIPIGNHLQMFLRHDLPWNISSVLWKKKALVSLNGFQEDFVRLQDVELHTRALLSSNLKYGIANNRDLDFYYRINPNRNTHNQEIAFVDKLKGVSKYITYFDTILGSNKNHLKGTAISAYRDVLYFYNGKEIENRMMKAVLAKIFNSNTKMEKIVLAIYTKMFSMGFSKIKGFNFLFKKLFIYS